MAAGKFSTCNFAAWAISVRGLKCSTVTSYLSSLSTIHELKGHESKECSTYLTKRVLQGAQNLEFYTGKSDTPRKAMSLPLLKLIGHEIARSDWSDNSKQVIFTAALIAFFGAFRMGEILCKNKWEYNQFETLTWSDIIVTGVDSVLIHLKMDKSRNPKGSYIDIFAFSGHGVCPIQALMTLKNSSSAAVSKNKPVFSFENGMLLTVDSFVTCIQELLTPYLGPDAKHIQGHSFRAAIPSAMADFPELADNEEIKSFGRWCSDSFQLYTRLQLNKKRSIFKKIMTIFK